MKHNTTSALLVLLVMAGIILFVVRDILAVPGGAAITYVRNSTNNGSAAGMRNDSGGYIYVTNLNSIQQNLNWKAYVGNITGIFTLDDANNMTIYDWQLTVTGGEVYASRSSSIVWGGISCASPTNISAENGYFGYSATAADNINNTFNTSTHKAFRTGMNSFSQNSCNATQLFVNDSRQAVGIGASFQEILLSDNRSIVYASIIESGKYGFDNTTYNFQMIIPENGSVTSTTAYYFWAEIE